MKSMANMTKMSRWRMPGHRMSSTCLSSWMSKIHPSKHSPMSLPASSSLPRHPQCVYSHRSFLLRFMSSWNVGSRRRTHERGDYLLG